MNKILKTVTLCTVSACVLFGACACNNSVSDIRRRERKMHERQKQEQRLADEQKDSETEEEIDPGFSVDPEFPQDTPEQDREERNPLFPDHGKLDPRFGRPNKPDPVPFPLPRN